jgi:hypothetical protein
MEADFDGIKKICGIDSPFSLYPPLASSFLLSPELLSFSPFYLLFSFSPFLASLSSLFPTFTV